MTGSMTIVAAQDHRCLRSRQPAGPPEGPGRRCPTISRKRGRRAAAAPRSKHRPDELHADRQPAGVPPAGQRSAPGRPARFTRDGVDVLQVHRAAGRRSSRRGGRPASGWWGIEAGRSAAKAAIEVALDQAADLERLEVVGVVVAAGQGVGAEHDAPLRPPRRSPRAWLRQYSSMMSAAAAALRWP